MPQPRSLAGTAFAAHDASIASHRAARAEGRGHLNRRIIRTAAVLAAALLVGAVGFAVANAVVEPPVSQIPTVVTVNAGARTSSSIAATVAAPLPATTATQPTSARPAKAVTTTHDEREVVKPSMRDDGDNDGDDNGSKPSDQDKDDRSSTGKTNTAAIRTPATSGSTHSVAGDSGSGGSTSLAPSTAHVQATGHTSAVQNARVIVHVAAPAHAAAPAHTAPGSHATTSRRARSAWAGAADARYRSQRVHAKTFDRRSASSGKNTGGVSH